MLEANTIGQEKNSSPFVLAGKTASEGKAQDDIIGRDLHESGSWVLTTSVISPGILKDSLDL
jgi:hypothetical protein